MYDNNISIIHDVYGGSDIPPLRCKKMIDYVRLPFDVLFSFAPLISVTMVPIFCFGLFLGMICIIKEMFKFV